MVATRTEVAKIGLPGHGRGQTWGLRGVGQSIFEESVTPKHKLGDRLQLGPRVFYYARAGAALVAGSMVSFNVRMNYDDVPVTNHGIGTTELTVLDDSTGTAKDAFAEGMVIVHDGTGEGDQYIVKSNAVAAASTNITVTIYEPGLQNAWGGTTDITLVSSAFYDMKEAGAATASGAGTSLIAITDDGYYFWLQTYGPAAVEISAEDDSGAGDAEQAMTITSGGMLVKATAGDWVCAHSLGTTIDSAETNSDFGYVWLTCAA